MITPYARDAAPAQTTTMSRLGWVFPSPHGRSEESGRDEHCGQWYGDPAGPAPESGQRRGVGQHLADEAERDQDAGVRMPGPGEGLLEVGHRYRPRTILTMKVHRTRSSRSSVRHAGDVATRVAEYQSLQGNLLMVSAARVPRDDGFTGQASCVPCSRSSGSASRTSPASDSSRPAATTAPSPRWPWTAVRPARPVRPNPGVSGACRDPATGRSLPPAGDRTSLPPSPVEPRPSPRERAEGRRAGRLVAHGSARLDLCGPAPQFLAARFGDGAPAYGRADLRPRR